MNRNVTELSGKWLNTRLAVLLFYLPLSTVFLIACPELGIAYELNSIITRYHITESIADEDDFNIDADAKVSGYGLGLTIATGSRRNFAVDAYFEKAKFEYAADYRDVTYLGDSTEDLFRIKAKYTKSTSSGGASGGLFYRYVENPAVERISNNISSTETVEYGKIASHGLGLTGTLLYNKRFERLFFNAGLTFDFGIGYSDYPENRDYDFSQAMPMIGASFSANIGQEFDRVSWAWGWSLGAQATTEFASGAQVGDSYQDGQLIFTYSSTAPTMLNYTIQLFVRY